MYTFVHFQPGDKYALPQSYGSVKRLSLLIYFIYTFENRHFDFVFAINYSCFGDSSHAFSKFVDYAYYSNGHWKKFFPVNLMKNIVPLSPMV